MFILVILPIGDVSAHGGGTPRLTNVPAGPYRLFVWSQPEPLRVGEVHLTIGLTTDAESAAEQNDVLVAPVTDATVTMRMVAVDRPDEVIETTAGVGGLGAVYYETDASLPTPGEWRFIIDIQGDAGAGMVEFREVLLPARTVNVPLLVGGALMLLLLIGLVGVWNRRQGEGDASHSGSTTRSS